MPNTAQAYVSAGSSPLFSARPVAPDTKPSPVIVVGLPRSGSSFLASVLSQIDDWYVFDDLYIYQKVLAMNAAEGALNPELRDELIEFLGWQLRARIRQVEFEPPKLSLDEVEAFNEAMRETFAVQPVTWDALLEEWMYRLALHHGKHRWGYKVPQDFMHAHGLAEAFPGVRFVFIYRDPRQVMASLKYVHDADGHPWQYHPLPYAQYWRMAMEAMAEMHERYPGRVLGVKFEDLVADPDHAAGELAVFLESKVVGPIRAEKRNTSFAGEPRRSIGATEKWVCERVAGEAMKARGYKLSGAKPKLTQLPELAWISLRFTLHQLKRIFTSGTSRQQIKAFVRSLFSGDKRNT